MKKPRRDLWSGVVKILNCCISRSGSPGGRERGTEGERALWIYVQRQRERRERERERAQVARNEGRGERGRSEERRN